VMANSTEHPWGPIHLIESFDDIGTFQSKYSFTNAVLYNNHTIVLKFDTNSIQNERIKQIILEGLVKQNISERDYVFDATANRDTCNSENCSFIVSISNNLNLPVQQEDTFLTNINNQENIKNKSKCNLASINSNFSETTTIKISENSCKDNHCFLTAYNINKHQNFFSMMVDLDESGRVHLSYLVMQEPMSIYVRVELTC